MKKFLLKTSLAIAGLLASITASAHDFEVDGIYYRILDDENNTVSVTYKGDLSSSYIEYEGDIDIHSTVIYDDESYSVTEIGNDAFKGCTGLTSVTIPNSVTEIGIDAFGYCSSLTSVTIGNSVTTIGCGAFENCSSLTSVTIPNKVTLIDDYAFHGCSGLTSVTIPNSVTEIGKKAFYDCSGLISVTIPNSVTEIGCYAFYNCSGLTEVNIPNSVTEIGNDAFGYCSGLTSVTIGNSVTTIGYGAFENCSSLTSVTIPNKVTLIYDYTFHGCSGLTSVTIPNSVTEIGGKAFYDCSGLTSVTIPNSVTEIGCYAFYNCSGLTELTIPYFVTSIGEYTFYGCSGLTEVNIPNSVTEIGNDAFKGCSSLTSVTIPNSVTEIGESAFEDCTGLTSVTIGNSVTEIGSSAFGSCSNLTEVNFNAENCILMESEVFGCSIGLKTVNIGDNVKSIPADAFEDCVGLIEVNIGNSVTEIGERAFFDCCGLTSVTIPNSVTEIGYDAFGYCSGLTSVTIGNSVTTIGSNAFSYCSSLTSVTIPNSVTEIGNDAFGYCSGLTSVTIGNSVTTIGSNAFSYCSSLASVTIPNSVTEIGYEAFRGCTGLTDLIIEDGEDAISGLFFPSSPLETLYLGRTTSDAFANDKTTLKTLTIGNKVTLIGENAFLFCSGLTSVTIGDLVSSIGINAFYGCSSLTSVTIPNSVTDIGESAFGYCSGLTSVTIGNSVTSIGDYAFYGCSGLAKVYCAASVPPNASWDTFSYQYTTHEGDYTQTQLYVPASSVDLYRSTSPWSNFLIDQYGELKLYKSSYYTFENYYTEDKTYKSMNGITADGTSQIFIPIEEDLSSSDFSIILTINGETASTEFTGYANQTIQEMPNGEKGIIYTAPKTFDELCMSDSYIVELTFDMINENGLTNIGRMPIEIEVHRPGLLMVHGLNSSNECWSVMQNDLLQDGLYQSHQINNINYSSSNLSSFDYNTHEAKVIENGVKNIHDNLINNGIVSSKYDMIGHSMGGILIRKYAQEVDGAIEMVNSIITVNTPHHGSQLANVGMYVERIGSKYLSYLKPFIDYITKQSAIYDLQIDGSAIKKLNQKNCSGIPIHAISSTIEDIDELYSSDIRQENINYSSENISNSLGNIIEVLEASSEGNMKGALDNFYKLIYSDKSDGIVSLSSQQGGLSGLCTTNNIDQIDFSLPAPMWSWAHHCLNTKWDVTMNDIKALLCASKEGPAFTLGGFNYTAPLVTYTSVTDVDSLIFAEPQADSFIKLDFKRVGDIQEIRVSTSDDVVSHCVYYISDNNLISALDCDTAKFILPKGSDGNITFYSLAKTDYGALITDSIVINNNHFVVDGIYYNLISATDKTVEVTFSDNLSEKYSGDIVIPNKVSYNGTIYSVTTIGYGAFNNCSSLTSVTISNSVTEIGDQAFYSCSGLTSVTSLNSEPPVCEVSTFEGVPAECRLYVSSEAKELYAAATGWSQFANIIGLDDVKVEIEGDNATFEIPTTEGAVTYTVNVYSDEAMTQLVATTNYDAAGNIIPMSTSLELSIDGFENGTYYYDVIAKSESGETLNNYTGSFEIGTSGIGHVGSDDNAIEVARYDIHGRLLSAPVKGINIVKYSDGTVKKLIIKN